MRRALAAAAGLTSVLLMTGCQTNTSTNHAAPSPPSGSMTHSAPAHPTKASQPDQGSTEAGPSGTKATGKAGAGTALAALATLPVKGRAPMTGYSRDQFGQAWSDAAGDFAWSRNGCDTRNDVLARDLVDVTFKSGTNDCVVLTGTLPYEPYIGHTVHFVRGGSYDEGLDIDHIIPEGLAWVTGAQQWSAEKRAAFANDPLNLLPVDPSQNRSKGDADAATWLPQNKSVRCAYVARQVTIRAKYGLWVLAPEKAAIENILSSCPDQPLAEDGRLVDTGVPAKGSTGNPDTTTKSSSPVTAEKPSKAATGSTPGTVTYANCDAVRAAGKAPIHAGDPGYSRSLDRDGDGTACE